MHESVVNLHMHTRYSDGSGSHADIAAAALRAGIDVVIVTDHNVWVDGPGGYHGDGQGQRVLLMVGEEIHDQARDPQKNHLLVLGARRELAHLAPHPQRLIDGAREAGGISFLAHPIDAEAPKFAELDLSWVSWNVRGYTGIELWNGMTEFKSLLKSTLHALFYAYFPTRVARGPFPETLEKWDELLSNGDKVVAIGGSDAHAFPASLGPLHRVLYPYEFHFRAINTHVLTPEPLSGEAAADRRLILEALRRGRAFIGYDLPAPTSGFRFSANHTGGTAWMGDEVGAGEGATLQVRLPRPAECRLLKDGQPVRTTRKRETFAYAATDPGVYRVEVYLHYKGGRRGWIFSNPIYVR